MTEPGRLPQIAPYAMPDTLPAPRAPFRLERERAALLVHDMQAYFCAPYARGESPFDPLVPNIARLLAAARATGLPVFYTAQEVRQDPRDRGLQAALWGPGMQDAEAHRPILTELSPTAGDHVLVKHRYSAFQRSPLAEMLAARGRDQLIVCGIYAHIGVQLTVAEAFMRDVEPFLVADAVADFSAEQHLGALDWVAAVCGVPLWTKDLVEALA